MVIHSSVEYNTSFCGVVNCTDAQYFSDPGINCSGLKEIYFDSAYHWHMRRKVKQQKDTEALRLGSLIHALVLGTPAISDFLVYDGASKDSKKFREWLETQEKGRDVVLERELEAANKIYKYAYQQNDLIKQLQEETNHHEVAAFYDRMGYRSKAKADALYLPETGDGTIWDLKTTKSLGEFSKDARKYGYHMQDVWYRDVFQSALKRRMGYKLIVIEKAYPYSVVKYDFSDWVLEQGRKWINEGFARYCVGFDTGVWAKPETNITLDWRY